MWKLHILIFAVVGIFGMTSLAQAGKPSWAGGGKEEKHEQQKKHDGKTGREGGRKTITMVIARGVI